MRIKRVLAVMALAALCLCGLTAAANAKEKKAPKPKPEKVKLVGTVSVQREAPEGKKGGKPKNTAITFTAEGGEAYPVVLNRKAEGLVRLEGKTIEVEGVLAPAPKVKAKKGEEAAEPDPDEKWLHVSKFKEAKEKKAKDDDGGDEEAPADEEM